MAIMSLRALELYHNLSKSKTQTNAHHSKARTHYAQCIDAPLAVHVDMADTSATVLFQGAG